ncbi:MAG: zinc ribbon domain-containing protein [Bacillota bacterium]|nr:zinc ribbon domain-containing protein [Bacillota bacterium]
MGNDVLGGLGGLGGLVKGLSGLMPQDDPAVKMLNAQTEYSDLQKKEQAQLAAIGQKAIERDGIEAWGAEGEKLKAIRISLTEAKAALDQTKQQAEAEQAQEQAAKESRTCPSCGCLNEEGVKFCQECGTKLGPKAKIVCPSCNAELEEGVRFCGSCGHRMEV